MTTVLIIDDDPLLLALVKHKLSSRGYVVETAENGEAGLAKALQTPPDLIVLDIMMPVLDGRAVLQEIMSSPALAGVEVVMLTSKGRESDVVDLLRLGAADYLVKPFSPEELVARIDRLTAVREAAP